MRKYLAILIVVWFAVEAMPAHNQVSSQSATAKGQQSTQQPSTPAIIPITSNQAAKYNQQDAADKPHGWHKFVTWPEGITAWLLMLTLIAIVWQARETRSAAKSARDAIILQHRPKVYVRSIRVHRPSPTEMEVWLTVRNGGSTIAHIQDGSFQIQWLKDGVPEPRPDEKIEAFDLQPGEAKTLRFSANEFAGAFGAEEIMHEANSRIRRDAVLLTCNGVIRYLDEIGTQRETGIARICDFATRQFVPVEDAEREYSD